jgi:hypothetical protein
MPEGEWSFLSSAGPKRQVNISVTPDAELVLRAVAAMYGVRRSTLAGVILQGWASDYLDAHADELSDFVCDERARRASPVSARTSSGHSMHGAE